MNIYKIKALREARKSPGLFNSEKFSRMLDLAMKKY